MGKKYRVWDADHKKMIYFTLQDLISNYCDEDDYSSIVGTRLFKMHQYIDADKAMEFTGLQDKNGKPIYEGDIVAGGIGENYHRYIIRIGQSETYVDGCFTHPYYGVYLEGIGGDMLYELMERQLIIIGNIHENPEIYP